MRTLGHDDGDKDLGLASSEAEEMLGEATIVWVGGGDVPTGTVLIDFTDALCVTSKASVDDEDKPPWA